MKAIVSICSAIVWGSGQVMNKQYIKGLIFFFFQVILVCVDLFTGTLKYLNGTVDHLRDAGFFVKGIWGLVTLGDVPRADTNQAIYDHSVMLMMNGIISTVVLILILLMGIWGVVDAYRTRVNLEKGIVISTKKYFHNLWESAFEYIAIAPATLLILFISIIPILFTICVIFTNYNMNNIPPKKLVSWTGFQTFADVFTIPIWGTTFMHILGWTIIWAFAAALTGYAFGLLQAVLINSKAVKFKKVWRGIFILPWAIPALVSQLVFKTMLLSNGAFNTMLLNAGIVDTPVPFLSDPLWAKFTLIIVSIWLGFPYAMALISGIMTTIPEEIMEASSIDGATGIQQFKAITFPLILQAIAPLLIMSITFNFNNFGMIYFMTQGGPANISYQMAGSTDILITWIFKLTLDYRMYNYAGAMSLFIFVILATVSAFNLLRTRAFKEE